MVFVASEGSSFSISSSPSSLDLDSSISPEIPDIAEQIFGELLCPTEPRVFSTPNFSRKFVRMQSNDSSTVGTMGFVDWYQDVMQNKIDPRTSDWFMVTGPGPLLMIVMTYTYFSISAGPKYMRDKKPYTLRKTLIVYNFIQVLLSLYLVYEAIMAGWFNGYRFACEPVDYSMDPKAIRMARAVWLYYVCKLIELLDTVFFVLRKKDRQISFLHVYHHALMPMCAWIGVRFFPGGHATLLGFINSFIHVIMYGYYMLSAMGPEIQKYLWWKRYLTSLQLVQFSIILVQNVQLLFVECNFPRSLAALLTFNAVLFMYLFGSFYVKNYRNSKVEGQRTKSEKAVPSFGARSRSVKSD